MRNLLNESKRDNMLLSYYNAIVESGIQISFGQFKSKLLQTLASSGGIHSLSQRSNYYLAGAARYYFNGDLTTNKDLSMLKPEAWEGGDVAVLDDWNDEVCKRLDACIKVLRNAYIDSVGTTFEQPEDFGTLPIGKLLRKYNKAINKVLGIVTVKKEKELPAIDTNPNVGKNYTFEIMYSQADCQKYERPTAPGSWCITYGEGHYNYYVRHLGIHYVIFRQDGWENIQRPSDPLSAPGFTREKPHDVYGNSLIALLQSNTSPEPVYITSRWNHGREVHCEADHAYTKEEFEQITGVTDDDLARIFEIWKRNKPKVTRGDNGGAKTREENKEAIRALKYIQMRINAGENPNVLLRKTTTIVGSDNDKIQNCVSICKVMPENEGHRENINGYYFLVDRGKIIYDTALKINFPSYTIHNNILLLEMSSYEKTVGFAYDLKTHQLITINGIFKFMSIPTWGANDNSRFAVVNRSARDFAMIDFQTRKPVQLPNGEFWSNSIKTSSWDWRSNRGKNGGRWLPSNLVIMIIYDESSGERYLFDTKYGKFLPNPIPNWFETDNQYRFNIGETYNDNYYSVSMSTGRFGNSSSMIISRQTNEYIDFGLKEKAFNSIQYNGYGLFIFDIRDEEDSQYAYIGNAKENKLFTDIDGKILRPLDIGPGNDCIYRQNENDKYLGFVVKEIDNNTYACKIIDKETMQLVNNPYHTESDPTLFILKPQNQDNYYYMRLFDHDYINNLLTKHSSVRYMENIRDRVSIQDVLNGK